MPVIDGRMSIPNIKKEREIIGLPVIVWDREFTDPAGEQNLRSYKVFVVRPPPQLLGEVVRCLMDEDVYPLFQEYTECLRVSERGVIKIARNWPVDLRNDGGMIENFKEHPSQASRFYTQPITLRWLLETFTRQSPSQKGFLAGKGLLKYVEEARNKKTTTHPKATPAKVAAKQVHKNTRRGVPERR